MRVAFGADIGGTTVKLGLFSAAGELLEKWEIPTNTENGGEAILPDVARSIREKMAERSISAEQTAGIGLCVPGPVDEAGIVRRCVNLGWGIVDLKARMGELLPEISRVEAGNDANVAALGELRFGGGRGFESAVMLTLGTGVGGGVVCGGNILAGANGGAGEVGHMTVEPAETLSCTCGKCGCLEQYASARGIVRMAKTMLEACDTPSALRSMENFTAKEIFDLARGGEEMALAIAERCCDYLGRAMSYIACTVDPAVFILGGGMSRAGSLLTETALRYYRRYAFHVSSRTEIVTANLGNDAGIYGCAAMILA